jgi:hypothetical protein
LGLEQECFALAEGIFGTFALCDVHRRTNYFNDIIGSIHYRVSNHMDVLGRAVWQKKPIVDLKVAPAPNGLVNQGFVMTHVLRVQPPDYLDFGWWRGTRIKAEDPEQLF